jgi:hypothetical protein
MIFSSPIWLLGLLPWAVGVAVLLLGRRPRRDVPFLRLWRADVMPRPAPRRRVSPPPLAVVLALLAALAAVLAAGGPGARPAGAGKVVLIVDTGSTMSARYGDAPGADCRFHQACVEVASALAGREGTTGGPADLTVVAVPGSGRARVAVSDLLRHVDGLPGNATDTGDALARAVTRELADRDAPATVVAVVTDRPVPAADDPRVVRVAPRLSGRNLGIRGFAVRRVPRPQAMVRLTVETWAGTAGSADRNALPANVRVRVTAGGATAERVVPTPAAGEARDVFLDLPTAGPGRPGPTGEATATLVEWVDDLAADDRADLTVSVGWPTLEQAGPIGDLQRLVDLYREARRPGDASVAVAITAGPSTAMPPAGPAIVLPPRAGATRTTRATVVSPHPITAAVAGWADLDVPVHAVRSPPPAGFEPILADAAGPMVAVRTVSGAVGSEVRQVWSAIAADGWANRPEYVAFFSAAFDWVGRVDDGGGGDRMEVCPLGELSSEWEPAELAPAVGSVAAWPGVYRRRDGGGRQAFGPAEIGRTAAPVAAVGGPYVRQAGNPLARLDAALRTGDRTVDWTPWLLVVSLAMAAAAALAWRGG